MTWLVVMKWIAAKDEWHLYKHKTSGLYFLQPFPDCENINIFFPGLDKEKDNYYTLITPQKADVTE
jgi:hypothetical protein